MVQRQANAERGVVDTEAHGQSRQFNAPGVCGGLGVGTQ